MHSQPLYSIIIIIVVVIVVVIIYRTYSHNTHFLLPDYSLIITSLGNSLPVALGPCTERDDNKKMKKKYEDCIYYDKIFRFKWHGSDRNLLALTCI